MGLAEQIRAGASLTREIITINTDPAGSGSISVGPAYGVISIQTTTPCRFRLYDDEASLNDADEIARPFPANNIKDSVALVGDFSMSLAGTLYTIDPMLYGASAAGISYYRVEPASAMLVQIDRYLMEDPLIAPEVGSPYEVSNRRTLSPIMASLGAGSLITGSLASSEIPQTYLLISGSLAGAGTRARLRLYRNSSILSNATEQNRLFQNEPAYGTPLIADMILSGSEPIKFSPKILGANLENMGSDLNTIRANIALISGEPELYYMLNNLAAVTASLTASLHVFSLEEAP